MSKLDHVLFDLDGTLADTAPDLAYALNQVLLERGGTPLPLELIRPAVSLGGIAMISLAFGIDQGHKDFNDTRERFLTIYSENIAKHTGLFPGMEELLNKLEANDIPWGIVTNKPAWLTDPLIPELDLDKRTRCVVSGDTVAHAKPHPAPMLHACELLACRPEQVVYVGDARRDIEAGKNAGMTTLAAKYGYIAEGEKPEDWQADGMIEHPLQVLDWLPDLSL